mmetsp:Transcript_2465/g.4460  ORF Transcript_2465/g.4460 Transcript_2465/m.4460 type:complete len:109 (-) Transcript_2465:30-356(-)
MQWQQQDKFASSSPFTYLVLSCAPPLQPHESSLRSFCQYKSFVTPFRPLNGLVSPLFLEASTWKLPPKLRHLHLLQPRKSCNDHTNSCSKSSNYVVRSTGERNYLHIK